MCESGGGVCFFFSSRRRHTRLVSDWSSDVCSSDLVLYALLVKTLSLGNYECNKIHKTVKKIDFYVKFQ